MKVVQFLNFYPQLLRQILHKSRLYSGFVSKISFSVKNILQFTLPRTLFCNKSTDSTVSKKGKQPNNKQMFELGNFC